MSRPYEAKAPFPDLFLERTVANLAFHVDDLAPDDAASLDRATFEHIGKPFPAAWSFAQPFERPVARPLTGPVIGPVIGPVAKGQVSRSMLHHASTLSRAG